MAAAAAAAQAESDIELDGGPALDLDLRSEPARDIHSAQTLVPTAAAVVEEQPATTAHVMPAGDAGVGLQSLDLDIDMGDVVSADVADDLPVDGGPAVADVPTAAAIAAEDPRWGAPAQPVGLSAEDPRWGAPSTPAVAAEAPTTKTATTSVDAAKDIATLETLLERVQKNRRPRAA